FERMYVKFGGEETESAQTKGPEGEITRALSEALEDYFATHPPFLERMDELRALLDWNMAAWQGREFYVGASNHRDRLSRAQDERAEEFVTYSASSTDYLLARGKIASLVGRSSEAMSFFREALEKDPQLLEARKGLAAVYLQIGKAEEALDQFAQIIAPLQIRLSALEEELAALPSGDPSIEMDPLNRLIALLEEIRSLQRAKLDIMEKAQLPTLEEERRMLKELEEALLDARARRAELHMTGGRLDEALAEFRAVKSARPNSLEAIKGEISALKAKGWHFAALEATHRAVSRFPEIAELLRIRADLYDLLGREEEAEREMARYTRFAEEGVPPLTDEAWADFVRMLDHLFGAKAMAINDNGRFRAVASGKFFMGTAAADALADCAREAGRDCALYALGDAVVWGDADAALDRLVEAYDEAKIKEAESWISVRDLSRESFLGDKTLNEQIYQMTNAIRGGQESFLLSRANLYRQLGRLRAAVVDADAYLERYPKSLNGRLLRGTILLKLRDYEKALADFREITTRAPASEQSALSHAAIAEVHLQNDDFEAAVREFRSADLPKGVQPLLDHGMCLALARRALPAAALPYCEAALRSPGGEGQAEYHDTKAFVLWQLRRTEEAEIELSLAHQLDPQRPIPFARMGYFGILITEIFLRREGYISGRVDGRYDASTASAVARYRSREGLPRGGIDENLIGRITPLGFFAYRIEGIRDQLAPDFIKMSCVPATRGKYKTIRAANGRLYLCNSDGVSVRPLRLPPRLDYESRAEGEWLRCYDPDRDIAFALDPSGPPSSLRSCGGTAYRISEEEYRKIQQR
ncbi:MAG: tetratricopeptide repeat protein, partial [Thalassovita sp.]|nr:tetratricopeptide repeat protein [Thalassovita sp.]